MSPWRQLRPGQRSQVVVLDVRTGESTVVHESGTAVVEAPNWTPDGQWLVVNSDGLLLRLPADGSAEPSVIDTGWVRDANNDHVLSPDGRLAYLSSMDGHLYEVELAEGEVRRVSSEADGLSARYLHGITPDGATLLHIGQREVSGAQRFNVFTLAVHGGATVQLTDSDRHHDGAEPSPDGQWVYFNSDRGSQRGGHSQLFRMRADGSEVTQLTDDERVNWFPHPSPDGRSMVHLSYPPGTTGHPPDLPVLLRASDPEGRGVSALVELFGGQGTLNVNSWAPDSSRFAYVAYPLD